MNALGGIIIGILMNIIIFTAYYMKKTPLKFMIIFLLSIINLICTSIYMTHDIIPAIEVYRGNTELVITEKVVNGEIIKKDSTVVLK